MSLSQAARQIVKSTYKLIPFKREIFGALKMVWTPPFEVYQHLHFKGTIKVAVDKEHEFLMQHYGYEIENALFWVGLQGWEKYSMDLWKRLCTQKKDMVIFDIGANTGIYSLLAKCVNPSSDVYAMEPVARVFEKLVYNVKLNNYPVQCFPVAASNYEGSAMIYDTTEEHTLSVTVNYTPEHIAANAVKTEIQVRTLDSIIREKGLQRIDLMKIDVERHEPEVLEGFAEHLKKFRPTMLIEILNDDVADKVSKLVSGIDYLFFNIDELTGIRHVDKITKSDYYNFLFCDRATAEYLKLV